MRKFAFHVVLVCDHDTDDDHDTDALILASDRRVRLVHLDNLPRHVACIWP